MTRRPPLRSATPEATVPVPRPRQSVEPMPAGERPDPLSGSIFGGRSILGGPSIFASGAVPPAAPVVRPAGPVRHRRPVAMLAPARYVGRAARSAGRSTRVWAGRPSGRFVLPLVAIVALLAATGTVGNYATRASVPAVHPSATPSGAVASGESAPDPNAPGPDASTDPGLPAGPPQDAVAPWAKRMSPAVGISETALKAYGYATLRVGYDAPACHLAWTTLAAIGKVESDHGTANGSTLQSDGTTQPPIVGPPLDGQGGRQLIPDSDNGQFDGDRVYDRAVGPMQFLPSTWQRYQTDADQDGRSDPNDLNDAALAAGEYLCAGGKDLATVGGWWGAIYSYNALTAYAKSVFDAANDYGLRSRSVA